MLSRSLSAGSCRISRRSRVSTGCLLSTFAVIVSAIIAIVYIGGVGCILAVAATAIGTRDDSILVYFLAAREDGIQIENPRQVSAFDYPSQYAPKSPAFSRAMVKQWGDQQHLDISGTASILGHETRHRDKLIEQLDECLNNVDILVTEADKHAGIGIHDVSDLTGIKLYLR